MRKASCIRFAGHVDRGEVVGPTRSDGEAVGIQEEDVRRVERFVHDTVN